MTEDRAPLVTVIVPAFNAAGMISECLRSVMGQSYKNQEIIVVDDASTDETLSIVADLAACDPRIRLIRSAVNQGPAAARNAGLANARGHYCAFIDADDVWEDSKIERQVAALSAAPSAVLCCCNAVWQRDGVSEGYVYDGCTIINGELAWKSILANCFVGTPCVVLKSAVARQVGGFDPTLTVGEDQDLWLRMALAGPVIALPEVLVRYRRRAGSYMDRNRAAAAAVWLPRLERHIEALQSRLSVAELRHVRRTRYCEFARNLYHDGDWRAALPLFRRAIQNGLPLTPTLLFLLSASPPSRRMKAWWRQIKT